MKKNPAHHNIVYKSSLECGEHFKTQLLSIITQYNLVDVCDIGGGANPIFNLSTIIDLNVKYSLIDISETELSKAPDQYEKYPLDVLDSDRMPKQKWDFIFSQTLAEHVKDGRVFHENLFQALKPGGFVAHLYPTLYAIPFFVNKILPEQLSSKILDTLSPRDRYQHDKFPAYYNWCYGPTRPMINMLSGIGYEIHNFQGLIGHRYYHFFKPLYKLQQVYDNFLLKHPNPYQTSYAILILKKPNA